MFILYFQRNTHMTGMIDQKGDNIFPLSLLLGIEKLFQKQRKLPLVGFWHIVIILSAYLKLLSVQIAKSLSQAKLKIS